MVGFAQRGLRNNNPFNIKISNSQWFGKIKNSSDPVFEQFRCMYYGIRAGMLILRNYVAKGYNTPRKIIERFAPRSENATNVYLDFICDCYDTRFVGPDEVISSLSILCRLASRMVQFENGITPVCLSNIGCDANQLLDICNYYHIKL